MSNIRDIVRRHIESETIKELKTKGIPDPNISSVLEVLRKEGHIDKKVNGVLDAFRDEIEKESPRKRKQRWNKGFYAILNLALTILIAVAVNNEVWIFVWGLAAINVIVHLYFTIFTE
ncbi:hypothetical protein [Halalkalibacter krulwichiae]|uniref:2TM domain-containing protein n=1 Tax=Halalkalibacter krulwichiae TaxID=199441 RepID=A0A1X9M8H0_9BACI|nr:hypothetical protein [Halalkalibacter krulwichiae]ARK29708.1 hypothetical protein BkAM31D_07435 [Halalkalibacter krulwichiae]